MSSIDVTARKIIENIILEHDVASDGPEGLVVVEQLAQDIGSKKLENYVKYFRRKIGRRHKKREPWTLDGIVLDFIDYLEEGGDIYSRVVSKKRKATIRQLKNYEINYYDLRNKAAKYLSTRGQETLADKCRNYEKQLKKPGAFKVKEEITPEKLIDAIQFYHGFGLPLYSIKRFAPRIYKETCRKIGWIKACERATGIPSTRRLWSQQRIINELITIARNKEEVNYASLKENHSKLYATIEARKYFPEGLLGVVNAARQYLEKQKDELAARFDYDKIKKSAGRHRKNISSEPEKKPDTVLASDKNGVYQSSERIEKQVEEPKIVSEPLNEIRTERPLITPAKIIHHRKESERESYEYFKDVIDNLEQLLTQPEQKRTIIFAYNQGMLQKRTATQEEQRAIDTYYDWDKKDDEKIIVIAPETDKMKLLCDALAFEYKHQLVKARDLLVNHLPALYGFVMQQYEMHRTVINHPVFNILRLDPATKRVYKRSLIIAQPQNDSFDTTKPLKHITVNPICLDTLLDLLTTEHPRQDDEEILYLQITRYFASEISRKLECYPRTYHTANHGVVLED